MSKKIGTLRKAYRQSPIRLAFLLLALLMLAIFGLSTKKTTNEPEVKDMILQLLSLLAWIFLLVFAVATLGTTLLARCIFAYRRKHIRIGFGQQGLLQVQVPKTSIPLLGRLYMQLSFADHSYSDLFLLNGNNIIDPGLNDIRAYYTAGAIFIFEDMLGLSRLSTTLPLTETLLNAPRVLPIGEMIVRPSTPMDEEIRSTNVTFAPGEWLRYKSYESGDDLRRIVWKIYAKNKELLVRTQELQTIYANTISLYVALDTHQPQMLRDAAVARHWLNYFKNMSFSVFDQLKRNAGDLRFGIYGNADMYHSVPEVANLLTQNTWQAARIHEPLAAANILIFHSCCGTEWLQSMLNIAAPGAQFFYVRLSKAMAPNTAQSLIARLFFKPKNELEKSVAERLLEYRIMQEEAALQKIIGDWENVTEL